MKKTAAVATSLGMAVFLLASDALAQNLRWPGGGGRGPGVPQGGVYDPDAVETVSGEVVRIEQRASVNGVGHGVHLRLRTDRETVDVHLGPWWYVEEQDTKFTPGDLIEVRGSRATFGGKPAIIAGEIRKGEQVLMLRDANGVPMWAGWRRPG